VRQITCASAAAPGSSPSCKASIPWFVLSRGGFCTRIADSFLNDAVEKVGGTLTTRNNRIAHDGFLKFDEFFESILLRAPPQNYFFDTIGTKCDSEFIFRETSKCKRRIRQGKFTRLLCAQKSYVKQLCGALST